MVIVDHGIAQLIVLIAELQNGFGHLGALGQSKALGEATSGDIADDHLQGNDGDLPDDGFTFA